MKLNLESRWYSVRLGEQPSLADERPEARGFPRGHTDTECPGGESTATLQRRPACLTSIAATASTRRRPPQ